MDRGPWQAMVHGLARAGHDLATKSPPQVGFTFYHYISTLV